MSTNQTADVELVTWNYIRKQYENKHNSQNVPMALKYLILQFSRRVIGCKMLNVKQDIQFINLLLSKLPSIRRFKLLYRASDNAYCHRKFHKLCDDQGPTICIIKSNAGNIFGGYTSKSWYIPENQDEYFFKPVTDQHAFLFLIKSNDESIKNKLPTIIEMMEGRENGAICCGTDYGPTFGMGHEICIRGDCNAKVDVEDVEKSEDCTYADPLSFMTTYESDVTDNLSGSKVPTPITQAYLFQVIDYEVFNVQ